MDTETLVRNIPKVFYKKGMPVYYLFHVTARCNARCAHCFSDPERRQRAGTDELTLDEIEKISLGMGFPIWINITGGEPFLREDLQEILRLLYVNNRVRVFKIVSNGSLPDRVIPVMEGVSRSCPSARFVVNLSIDGVGPEHDRIRGRKGLFQEVQETYWGLKRLEKRADNYETCVEVTVSSMNQDRLEEIVSFYVNDLKTDNMACLLVRGRTRDRAAAEVDMQCYESLSSTMDRLMKAGRGYHSFAMSDIVNAKNLYMHRVISRTARTGRAQVPCYALALNATIYANGDLVDCEIYEKVAGSLRDMDYDFKGLWFSKAVRKARAEILKRQCNCTHECYLNTGILFNCRNYPQLFRQWLRLKRGRDESYQSW